MDRPLIFIRIDHGFCLDQPSDGLASTETWPWPRGYWSWPREVGPRTSRPLEARRLAAQVF